MKQASYYITQAMRLFQILDAQENPSPTDIANNVPVLSDMLRSDYQDACASFNIRRFYAQLPPGAVGQVYTFNIGIADPSYVVQQDVVGVRMFWMNDLNLTINREVREAPSEDVVVMTYPSVISRFHQERQSDGSVLITAGPPPRASARAYIEAGFRIPALTNTDGSEMVMVPAEAGHATVLALGRRICTSYGVNLQQLGLIAVDAERVHNQWTDQARGRQWMQIVRR